MIRPEHIEELLSLPVDERRRLLRLLQESLVVESERRSELPNGDHGSPAAKWLLSKSAGMRRGEVFGLKWFDVDFKRGQLQVQKTKTKLNRTVPMNAVVREVLARQAKSSEHVFPSPRTKARLVDLKKGFNEARLIAGVPDFQSAISVIVPQRALWIAARN